MHAMQFTLVFGRLTWELQDVDINKCVEAVHTPSYQSSDSPREGELGILPPHCVRELTRSEAIISSEF